MPSRNIRAYQIHGMTCRNCEISVERKLAKIPRAVSVRTDLASETVMIEWAGEPAPILKLKSALGKQYKISAVSAQKHIRHSQPVDRLREAGSSARWFEAAAMMAAVIIVYLVFQRMGFSGFSTTGQDVIGLGGVLLVGVAASLSSCLALVGGLLLSVSAKWCESRQQDTYWHKFKPLFLFNIGRLAGYFLLGGLIALLGTSVGLSVKSAGYLTIALALVMLWMGLSILKLIPKKYCSIPLPRRLIGRIYGLGDSDNPFAPAVLGALTFFVPCGFTQSMQLLALGSGSFLAGGLIMFTFALGTLPSLLGISILSSFAEGTAGRLFFRFSGALVILLAVLNLKGGAVLAGINIPSISASRFINTAATDPAVRIDDNGQQIISVYVTDSGYSPSQIRIKRGLSTWVYAYAPDNLFGCASQLTIPSLGISKTVAKGENWLGPVKNPQKDFTLACSMGMYTARVTVED